MAAKSRRESGLFRFHWILAAFAILVSAEGARADEPVAATHSSSIASTVDENATLPIPEPSVLAVRFHRTGHWVWATGRIWDLAVPLAIMLTGLSARMRDLAASVTRGWLAPTVAVYATLFLGLNFLVDLPLNYVFGFARLHAYGLSNQTIAKWLSDGVLGLGVEVVGAALFAWVPFWLIRRFPRSWWAIVAALSIPFTAFVVCVRPIWIDPLFNDLGPMKDKALETRIVALAQRAGIDAGRVFEVDKSVDTKAVNAYVIGLFGTHRIVLWDTLLKRCDDREVLAVMGHEMGHYVLGHVPRSIVLASLVVLAGLYWSDRAGRWALARFGSRLGIASLGDVAAIPLLLVLLSVASTVLGPVVMAYSRHQEREADRFSLELTRMNHSAARAFADLQRENLGIPRLDTFCAVFRSTHPCIADRIAFCNTYRPWDTGDPLVYGHLFQPEERLMHPHDPGEMPRPDHE